MTATRTRSAGLLCDWAYSSRSVCFPSMLVTGSRIGNVLLLWSPMGMLSMLIECPRLSGEVPQDLRRVARHDCERRRVAGHDAASSHDGVLADDHVREDCRAGS